mmetsp:Transcript_101390/g.293241  ORF Transcript_101390/g.293241 Transcript_101390/m.293241 type:complete len:270 (-) Transcript_101390:102-911(-)
MLPRNALPDEVAAPRIAYRCLPPVLNDGKIASQQAMGVAQDRLQDDRARHMENLEVLLNQREQGLTEMLATHRHGFERPSATLALYEPRPQRQEALHAEWLDHTIKFQEAQTQFHRHYGSDQKHLAKARLAMEKQERLKEMKGKVSQLQDQLLRQATELPQYADAEHVSVEEMRQRQKAMAQQVREFQANAEVEFAKERARNAELRTQNILNMQEQQRNLRNHIQLEKDHERLRLSHLTARAREQYRALNVGSPPWLVNLTPGIGEQKM